MRTRNAGEGFPKTTAVAGLLTLAVVVMLCEAWCFAYYRVFTAPLRHDDEGYLMISVKLFNDGRALYDEVFSQYGPFYYVYHWALYGILGVPVSHDATGLITMAHWLLTSVLLALVVLRATRWPWLACLAFWQTTYHLAALRNEPGHPHGLAIVAIALTLYASTYMRQDRAPKKPMAIIGAALGALLLIKINVGAFSCAAVGTGLLALCAPTRMQRAARLAAGVLVVAIPAALMGRDLAAVLEAPWFHYCVTVTLSLFSLLLVMFTRAPRGRLMLRDSLVPALALFGVVLVTCLVVLVRGTTFQGLAQGALLRALSFPGVFNIPPSLVRWNGTLSGVVSLGIAAAYVAFGFRNPAFLKVMAALKLGLGAVLLAMSMTWQPQAMLAYGTPFVWWLLLPNELDAPKDGLDARFPRALLALTASLQSLQAYPVCGTQQALASMCLLPVALVFVWDGLRVHKRVARWFSGTLRPAHLALVAVLAAAGGLAIPQFYGTTLVPLTQLRRDYLNAVPLGLPGADRIRLAPTAGVAQLNWVANNLRAHADTFLSLPGLNSFYFWAELPPPTGLNATTWMTLLSAEEQQVLLAKLDSAASPCVLCNQAELRFWGGLSGQASAETLDSIEARYKPALNLGDYTLLVRKETESQNFHESLLAGPRSFDGRDDVLPLPRGLIPDLTNFTMSFWFKTRSPGVLLGMQDVDYPAKPARVGFRLDVTPQGTLEARIGTQAPVTISAEARLDDHALHHVIIAGTRNGLCLFIDGTFASEMRPVLPADSCQSWQFAAGWDPSGQRWVHFAGQLRDGAFLPRTLTEAEVAAFSRETRVQ